MDIFIKCNQTEPESESKSKLKSNSNINTKSENVNVSDKKYKLISPNKIPNQSVRANQFAQPDQYPQTNTEFRCKELLDNIKPAYSDKSCLQEMLDETIDLLKKQEDETYKLKIRSREYEKKIEQQYNKIKELEKKIKQLESYIEQTESNNEEFKMSFFRKYTRT